MVSGIYGDGEVHKGAVQPPRSAHWLRAVDLRVCGAARLQWGRAEPRPRRRKARIALARRLAIIMHAMLRHGTEFRPA